MILIATMIVLLYITLYFVFMAKAINTAQEVDETYPIELQRTLVKTLSNLFLFDFLYMIFFALSAKNIIPNISNAIIIILIILNTSSTYMHAAKTSELIKRIKFIYESANIESYKIIKRNLRLHSLLTLLHELILIILGVILYVFV